MDLDVLIPTLVITILLLAQDNGSCTYANPGYDCDGNLLGDCVNDDSVGDSDGDTCSGFYDANPWGCGNYDTESFIASEMCCACGGGNNSTTNPPVLGCTDQTACNYSTEATDDDGSCEFAEEGYNCDNQQIFGCTDETAFNYDENATSLPTGEIIPGGSCNLEIWDGNYFGIDLDWYFDGNQNTFATGNKLYIGGNTFYVEYVSEIQENCNAPAVLVYVVTNPDGTSDGPVYVDAVVGENWYMDPCGVAVDGCTDSTADNFNEYATNDDGSCCYGSLATMGGSWYGLEQTSWSIINCNGQVIASASGDVNGDGSTYTVCVGVLPNSYEVVTGDTNGNGWNGNVLTIDGQVFSGPPQACASEYHPVLIPMVTIVQPQNRLGVVQDVQIYKHVITILMQHLVILTAVFIHLVDLIVTVIHYVMEHGLKIFHMEIVVITVLMNVRVL